MERVHIYIYFRAYMRHYGRRSVYGLFFRWQRKLFPVHELVTNLEIYYMLGSNVIGDV